MCAPRIFNVPGMCYIKVVEAKTTRRIKMISLMGVMANPGNMSDSDLILFVIIMFIVACGPVALGICMLFFRLFCTVLKWVSVGALAYLGWRIGAKLLDLDCVSRFRSAFMEAYNKNSN